MKVAKLSLLNEKSYNKTVIDFNFGRHKDLAASVNYHFLGYINPYVYLIEVNNCILFCHYEQNVVMYVITFPGNL